MILLHFIVLLPILAAIAILLGAPTKRTALGACSCNLLFTLLLLLAYNRQTNGYQFTSSFSIIPTLDLKYLIGVDGLSLVMLLLTSLVSVAALWVAPKIEKGEKAYYASLLFIVAGATGAFASLDLFFFYAFHELALIPTFLLIGIWGYGERQAAAWKITIYLALGSFVLLIGLIGLYQGMPAANRTFDIVKLQTLAAHHQLHLANGKWTYLCLLVGFGTLISLFPFHSWAPSAYASAPTPAAMLHAGVLKKFGLYGLLRVALPLLPDAAQQWTHLLLVLLLGNILYIGLVTIAQKRLDYVLGYSSVMHMGYIFLGIASGNSLGLSGAALLMFAHGLSIAALFALNGEVRDRTQTLLITELGGLAKAMPFIGLTFGMAAFASIGLPGFANFASEIMIFFGAFKNGSLIHFNSFQITTVCALWGVVISAVYMLRAYRGVFLGELNERWSSISGPGRTGIKWPIILLLVPLLLAGFYPQLFLNFITPAVKSILIAR